MNEDDFEGSLILEKLAELGLLEEFYSAVDADSINEVAELLREAEIDEDTIQEVMTKIQEG
jgi:hypothetical protein